MFFDFTILILFFPFISFFCISFFGFFLGRVGTFYISSLLMFFSFIISFFSFNYILRSGDTIFYLLGTWITCGNLTVNWSFSYDALASIMCLVVTSVSFFVHVYSWSYMRNDPYLVRFFCYLTAFTLFMLILVFSDNLVVFFFGWEGIGICSFLLISFWTTRVYAIKAAIKAVLINKIGDSFFLLGISASYFIFGSLDFLVMYSLVPMFKDITFSFFSFEIYVFNLITFSFLIAAATKSAQFGFHTWLPDAMEGPTPVSALIHAATLVTAGVFLIIRLSVLFEFCPKVLNFLFFWGSISSFIGALLANFQTDIKKIIAYSTCSQVGYMFISCGSSDYALSLFHLLNHAFFKALLFLCAGVMIHNSVNEQDIRKLSVSFDRSPFTAACFDIGLLCLSSFPFFGGFYSKDLIILTTYSTSGYLSFSYLISLLTAVLTNGYVSKLASIISEDEIYSNKAVQFNRHDSDLWSSFSIFFLSIFSIISGFYFQNIFDVSTSDFFSDSIYIHYTNFGLITQRDFVPVYIELLPLFLSIFWFSTLDSDGSDYILPRSFVSNSSILFYVEYALANDLFIDFYISLFLNLFKKSAYSFSDTLTYGVLESVTALGTKHFLRFHTKDKLLFSGNPGKVFGIVFIFIFWYSTSDHSVTVFFKF